MKRCNKIIRHPLYQEGVKQNRLAEKDRIFCLHDTNHQLDTARIGYILILENRLNLTKEQIYAAALLHDLARYRDPSGECHDRESAALAEIILPDCGFSTEETTQIADAIRSHRHSSGSLQTLSDVLYTADKLCRRCYECEARRECYWSDEKKNLTLKY